MERTSGSVQFCHSKVKTISLSSFLALIITFTSSKPISDRKQFGFGWWNGNFGTAVQFLLKLICPCSLALIRRQKYNQILGWETVQDNGTQVCNITRCPMLIQGLRASVWQPDSKGWKKEREEEKEKQSLNHSPHSHWTQGNLPLAPGLWENAPSSPKSIIAPLFDSGGAQACNQRGRESDPEH